MARTAIISCKNGHRLKVSAAKGTLAVTCPRCKDKFEWSPPPETSRAQPVNDIRYLRPPVHEKVQEAISARSSTPDSVARDAIRDVVGIDDHLGFSLKVFKKHKWDKATSDEVSMLLDEVQYRKNDPRLFLGVVGEFSSGKSTLINALLHDNLLRMDVLPATTSAATITSYGESLDAEVLFLDGQRKSFSGDKGTLRGRLAKRLRLKSARAENGIVDFIHRYSADERHACKVAALTILYPSSALLNGLVIVDTPGTNVDNPRHAEVVAQALRFICDAAIVVIPADIPCSQTLLAFMQSRLSDVLHRCVFILTKIDTVRRPVERERLTSTVQAIITRETGCQKPLVLSAAPLLVVDGVGGHSESEDEANGDGQALLTQFRATEQALYRFLEANKALILVERLVHCLTVLLDTLQEKLRGHEEYCRRYHDTLMRNRIPDLGEFVRQQQQRHTQELLRSTPDVIRNLPSAVERCREGVLLALHRDMDKADSTEAIKAVVEQATKHYMAWAQSEFQTALSSLIDGITSIAEQQHEQFKQHFLGIYKSLTSLDGSVGDAVDEMSHEQSLSVSGNSQSQVLINDLQEAIDQENAKMGGGAVAGAVIGTFFGPGIGTAIGAGIGAWVASWFGPSLEELKADAQSKLDASVHEAFAECEKKAKHLLDQAIAHAIASLSEIIEGYFRVYRRKVDAMIAKDAQMKDKLARYRKAVQGDLVEIRARHERLTAVREQLRSG